jgi:signal transduction histidine kinase
VEECIVFDLFSQVGQGRGLTQCGLGIGLSLVRGLVILQPWLALLSPDLRASQ